MKWTNKCKMKSRIHNNKMRNWIRKKIILMRLMNLILRKIWRAKSFQPLKNHTQRLKNPQRKTLKTSPWTTSLLSHKVQKFNKIFTWNSCLSRRKRKRSWMCSSEMQTGISFLRPRPVATQIRAILQVQIWGKSITTTSWKVTWRCSWMEEKSTPTPCKLKAGRSTEKWSLIVSFYFVYDFFVVFLLIHSMLLWI